MYHTGERLFMGLKERVGGGRRDKTMEERRNWMRDGIYQER